MTLTAAERWIVLAALLEFAASCESDFFALRECHTFLEADDADVNVKGASGSVKRRDKLEPLRALAPAPFSSGLVAALRRLHERATESRSRP